MVKKVLLFVFGVLLPSTVIVLQVITYDIMKIKATDYNLFLSTVVIILDFGLPITYLIFAMKNGKTLYLLALPIGYAISPIYSYWYEYVYRQGNSPNWGGSPLAVALYIRLYTVPCLALTSIICTMAIYYHWQKKKHRTNLKQNGDG